MFARRQSRSSWTTIYCSSVRTKSFLCVPSLQLTGHHRGIGLVSSFRVQQTIKPCHVIQLRCAKEELIEGRDLLAVSVVISAENG
ncbi:unnamed protein product [Calypogeia fissa]